MIFADGAELTLPTDRGGQYDAPGRRVRQIGRRAMASVCSTSLMRYGKPSAGSVWRPSCAAAVS